jgi:hypothetical protein
VCKCLQIGLWLQHTHEQPHNLEKLPTLEKAGVSKEAQLEKVKRKLHNLEHLILKIIRLCHHFRESHTHTHTHTRAPFATTSVSHYRVYLLQKYNNLNTINIWSNARTHARARTHTHAHTCTLSVCRSLIHAHGARVLSPISLCPSHSPSLTHSLTHTHTLPSLAFSPLPLSLSPSLSSSLHLTCTPSHPLLHAYALRTRGETD